jgi:FKBP-type peptidyl-prolyl cis-trans isomerase
MRLVRFAPMVALVACSKLTSPPAPEPIASDTPVAMASTPPAPSAARPMPREQQVPNQPPQGGDLKIEDLVPGKGPEVKAGDTVVVHYTGTLLDGTKFDSSKDHGQPFTTPIPGRVIQGWNKGIPGMKVGGKRKLTIPPSLGYGAQGQGKIPPNSTLVFEIELLEIKSGPQQPLMPIQIQRPAQHP